MPSKYNVSDTTDERTYDGIVFASALEMRYYRDVVLPGIDSGEIIAYELQKKYELQPKFRHEGKVIQPVNYVADFYIRYADGSELVIDTKGYPDAKALLKRKLFWYTYPQVPYRWVTYIKKYGGWIDYEYAQKCRRAAKRAKKAQQPDECKEELSHED